MLTETQQRFAELVEFLEARGFRRRLAITFAQLATQLPGEAHVDVLTILINIAPPVTRWSPHEPGCLAAQRSANGPTWLRIHSALN